MIHVVSIMKVNVEGTEVVEQSRGQIEANVTVPNGASIAIVHSAWTFGRLQPPGRLRVYAAHRSTQDSLV